MPLFSRYKREFVQIDQLACLWCNRRFKSSYELLQHNRASFGSYRCGICKNLSDSYESLQKHHVSRHPDDSIQLEHVSRTPAKCVERTRRNDSAKCVKRRSRDDSREDHSWDSTEYVKRRRRQASNSRSSRRNDDSSSHKPQCLDKPMRCVSTGRIPNALSGAGDSPAQSNLGHESRSIYRQERSQATTAVDCQASCSFFPSDIGLPRKQKVKQTPNKAKRASESTETIRRKKEFSPEIPETSIGGSREEIDYEKGRPSRPIKRSKEQTDTGYEKRTKRRVRTISSTSHIPINSFERASTKHPLEVCKSLARESSNDDMGRSANKSTSAKRSKWVTSEFKDIAKENVGVASDMTATGHEPAKAIPGLEGTDCSPETKPIKSILEYTEASRRKVAMLEDTAPLMAWEDVFGHRRDIVTATYMQSSVLNNNGIDVVGDTHTDPKQGKVFKPSEKVLRGLENPHNTEVDQPERMYHIRECRARRYPEGNPSSRPDIENWFDGKAQPTSSLADTQLSCRESVYERQDSGKEFPSEAEFGKHHFGYRAYTGEGCFDTDLQPFVRKIDPGLPENEFLIGGEKYSPGRSSDLNQNGQELGVEMVEGMAAMALKSETKYRY